MAEQLEGEQQLLVVAVDRVVRAFSENADLDRCATTTHLALSELIAALNPVLRGWVNYYRHAAASARSVTCDADTGDLGLFASLATKDALCRGLSRRVEQDREEASLSIPDS